MRDIEETSAMHRDEAWLYSILPGQGYFDAGSGRDGNPVLMGLYCPYLVAIFFDSSGGLLGYQKRRLEFLVLKEVLVDGEPIEGFAGTYDIYDPRIAPRLARWQEEIGFRPGTARLRRFFLDDLGIGIEDYPEHFREILDDPGSTDEERRDVRVSMRLWDEQGQFVLHWGNDYWLDDAGEVVAS